MIRTILAMIALVLLGTVIGCMLASPARAASLSSAPGAYYVDQLDGNVAALATDSGAVTYRVKASLPRAARVEGARVIVLAPMTLSARIGRSHWSFAPVTIVGHVVASVGKVAHTVAMRTTHKVHTLTAHDIDTMDSSVDCGQVPGAILDGSSVPICEHVGPRLDGTFVTICRGDDGQGNAIAVDDGANVHMNPFQGRQGSGL